MLTGGYDASGGGSPGRGSCHPRTRRWRMPPVIQYHAITNGYTNLKLGTIETKRPHIDQNFRGKSLADTTGATTAAAGRSATGSSGLQPRAMPPSRWKRRVIAMR